MLEKVRHVTFSAGDWLAAFVGLKVGSFAKGVYIDVIALCYDRGEPTLPLEETIARIAAMNGDNPRSVRAAIDKLADLGKLTIADGPNGRELEPKRVRTELERALNRIRTNREAGANGGRKSGEARRVFKEAKGLDKANASNETKLSKSVISNSINQSEQPAQSAPVVEGGRRKEFEDRVVDAAQLDPSRWLGHFGMLAAWRNAGCTEGDILAGIAAVASSPTYKPALVRSLNLFFPKIEEARDMRRAAEAKAGAPEGELERRVAAYTAAADAAKAAGLKVEDPEFPRPSKFGFTRADGRSVLLSDWKGPQSSQGAAA